MRHVFEWEPSNSSSAHRFSSIVFLLPFDLVLNLYPTLPLRHAAVILFHSSHTKTSHPGDAEEANILFHTRLSGTDVARCLPALPASCSWSLLTVCGADWTAPLTSFLALLERKISTEHLVGRVYVCKARPKR